jgi:hydroxymethylpyrimidine pyrophosphatase-like HAD family hydrolase
VGTVLHVGDEPVRWRRPRRRGRWDAAAIRAILDPDPTLEPQPHQPRTPRKVSYWSHDRSARDIDAIRERLIGAGMDVEVCYSSDRDLDILPGWAGKGLAARRIAKRFGLPVEAVITSGDSGNDVDLFRHGFRGIVVANAEAGLTGRADLDAYRSPLPHADGILDGIRHWTRGCCWSG